MIRFAHLSDTHLGYRQYGLKEREDDFYNSFTHLVDDIISESPDFILHSGDLFETNRPTNKAHYTFQIALERLNKENIPVFAIAGNHDISLKKDSLPPQILYRTLGLKLLSPRNPYYIYEDTFIGGIPYYPQTLKKKFLEKLEELSKKSENYNTRILMLHQGIDKFMPFNSELEIGEIPENFHYYAMGHLHNYINTSYGMGKLVYPGSNEIWKTSELQDYNKNGKGYVIATIKNNTIQTERKRVKISREFINKKIEYKNILTEIQNIKNNTLSLDSKPILNLTITGQFNTKDAYDTLHKYLDDYTLMIRPNYELLKDKEIINENIGVLDPKKFIHNHFKDSKYKDADTFAINLFNKLSSAKLEDGKNLAENYFKESFKLKGDN